ncbi:erythromycin resistance leader peptide [Bacillus sp. SD088]|nr:erythromycin resistance leader peptide [Bacillus sp. SD088]
MPHTNRLRFPTLNQ